MTATTIQDERLALAITAFEMGMRVVALQPDATPRDPDHLLTDVRPARSSSGHAVVVGVNGVRQLRLELGDVDRMRAGAGDADMSMIDRMMAGPAVKSGQGREVLFRIDIADESETSLAPLNNIITGCVDACATLTSDEVALLAALRDGEETQQPDREIAESTVESRPFGSFALEYLRREWPVVPIPPAKKSPPESGLTGRAGVDAAEGDVSKWVQHRADWNIAVRMPVGVVGIDVDHYGEKRGADHLASFQTQHSLPDLPPTTWLTARGLTSGIRLYQIPTGLELVDDITELANNITHVDIVQRHHRYAMAPPSINPSTGTEYQAIDEESGEILETLPHPDELPYLPHEWLRVMAAPSTTTVVRSEPLQWHNERSHDPTWHPTVAQALDGWQTRKASRHDSAMTTQNALVRLDSFKLAGAGAALDRLRAEFVAAVTADGTRSPEVAGAEFDRGLSGAKRLVAATEPTSAAAAEVGSAPAALPNLPDEFWNSRPTLRHIRQAAHSRMIGADALLGSVLARVAYLTPPKWQLPPVTGGPAPLNVIVAIIGPSGSGKTQAMSVARELLPAPERYLKRDGLAVGSGEGMAECFFETKSVNDGKKTKMERVRCDPPAALFVIDEGEVLAKLGQRNGTTLMEAIRSAWSGAQLGQANASADRNRHVPGGTYRLAVVAGFQPLKAAAILADSDGGTPQRFCWLRAVDPSIQRTKPEWPGSLNFEPPATYGHEKVHTFDYAPGIKDEIEESRFLANSSGVVDELGGHSLLIQLKFACLLALLDGRTDVTMEDRDLARMLVRTSNAVQQSIAAASSAEKRKRFEESTRSAEERATRTHQATIDTDERNALSKGARAIARAVHRSDNPITLPAAWRTAHSRVRGGVDEEDAAEAAIARGWVVVTSDGLFAPGESMPV